MFNSSLVGRARKNRFVLPEWGGSVFIMAEWLVQTSASSRKSLDLATKLTADIRLRFPKTKILLVSGFPEYSLSQQLKSQLSYDGYLKKPFLEGQMMEIIHEQLILNDETS